MRSLISITWLMGSFLVLAGGCGSNQTDSKQDALTTDKQDAAVGIPDAIADAAQELANASPQDAADTNPQDVGAQDLRLQDAGAIDGQGEAEVATGEAGANPAELASSPLGREAVVLGSTEQKDLATSLSGFAFTLLQELRVDPAAANNFAFSPVSISLALGMAYAGAAGNTAAEMKTAMQVTSASDAYFRSLNWLEQQLESRADTALKQAQSAYNSIGKLGAPPDPANYRLHVVNACWGDRTLVFEQPYLDTLATQFGSGVHLANFLTQPEAERVAINAWVSQETLNRINDLIPQGAIDSTTRSVLVNAIHLKLPWSSPFVQTDTVPATFTKTGGSTVSVPFMNKSSYYLYAEDDTTQAVAVPLSGSAVQLVVFLPKQTSSLAQFEGSLDQGHAQTLVASMGSQNVKLALPKFVFTTASVRLSNALIALGMTDAFRSTADFTGITKEKPLYIGDVVHKAMVGVDENGVEAAAATAVMLAGSGLPTDVKQVTANRPFFFAIYDQPTSTWLFLGHVTDPSS